MTRAEENNSQRVEGPDSTSDLGPRLADRDPKVRVAAVACLGLVPMDALAAPAVAYLDDPQSGDVRQQVLSSFAARPNLLTDDAILKRLHDAEPGIPQLAELVLKTRGLSTDQNAMGRLIVSPRPETRLGDPAGVRIRDRPRSGRLAAPALARHRRDGPRQGRRGFGWERTRSDVRTRLREMARRRPTEKASPTVRTAAEANSSPRRPPWGGRAPGAGTTAALPLCPARPGLDAQGELSPSTGLCPLRSTERESGLCCRTPCRRLQSDAPAGQCVSGPAGRTVRAGHRREPCRQTNPTAQGQRNPDGLTKGSRVGPYVSLVAPRSDNSRPGHPGIPPPNEPTPAEPSLCPLPSRTRFLPPEGREGWGGRGAARAEASMPAIASLPPRSPPTLPLPQGGRDFKKIPRPKRSPRRTDPTPPAAGRSQFPGRRTDPSVQDRSSRCGNLRMGGASEPNREAGPHADRDRIVKDPPISS